MDESAEDAVLTGVFQSGEHLLRIQALRPCGFHPKPRQAGLDID